ncbi:MAG: phosphomannomutase/phosphoglucomutase, partial [Gammaproteobacteria bacterium]|nr:phosphomannomutase/phosphoglucomutase [Gammaproteobacteria bacterium]
RVAAAAGESPGDAAAEAGIALPCGIFRRGDILGVVDEDLTARTATDVGQAIGTVAIERGYGRVAVARDGRFSGPILLSGLIRGLRNSGLDVIEVGAVPTPLLWFAAAELAEGCGVMVTGSHHPPKYNGFRVMIGGELLGAGEMADLALLHEKGRFAKGEGGYEQQSVIERYATRLSSDIQLERPMKVVVDCGNGVGGAVAPRLLEKIGADLIPLYCDVDGAFPNHRPDPSSPDDLEDLRLCVRNFQAELGIAFDGDADRLALVTKNGEIVWPDRMLMLLARDILATRPGEAVVYDVRASGHLQRVVEHAGGRGIMTASGQQPVAERLRQESAPLGGDMDGHLFINDRWYPFDDAIYAAARLLEMFAADTREVDEILEELPQFRASPEIVVATEREKTESLLEQLAGADFGDALVTRTDGVRADWSDRWGVARLNADTGQMMLRFGADEATALGRVRSEFRDKLLEIDPKLPLPY